MRNQQFQSHRFVNLIHTFLLFSGMILLLALLGWSLAGTSGLVWASILGAFFLYFSARVPARLVLRLAGARPLGVEEAPGVYKIVGELSRRAALPSVPRLFYLPNNLLNALTVGGRDASAIAVTAGLLRQLDSRELTGVLAHEISHLQQKDVQALRFAGVIGRITSLFAFFGQILLFLNIPLALMGQATVAWSTILILLAAPFLSGLLQMALSRTREFDADLGAVWLTGDPEGLARALEKMAQVQMGFLRRFLWPENTRTRSSLFSTHPATGERVARLRSLMNVQARPPILAPEEAFQGQRRSASWRRLPYGEIFRF